MASKQCNEHIPVYSPAEVFAAGTRTETLPRHIGGFVLHTEADQVRQGTLFRVGLLIVGQKFTLNAEVTEYQPGEHVLIRGKDRKIGTAAVWLDIAEHEELGGTTIEYGVDVRHSLFTKPFEPMVQQELHTTLPAYAAAYRENVVDLLSSGFTAERAA